MSTVVTNGSSTKTAHVVLLRLLPNASPVEKPMRTPPRTPRLTLAGDISGGRASWALRGTADNGRA